MARRYRSNRLSGHLISALLRLASLLPMSAARALAVPLGWSADLLQTDAARITRRNLQMALPELDVSEQRQLARRSLVATSCLVLEAGPVMRWPADRVLGMVLETHGAELLDQAAAAGDGVILLAPHLGNWEMVNLWLAERCALTAMYQKPRLQPLEPLLRQARERSGAELVPATAGGVRAVLKALRAGRVVGILPDQVPERSSGIHAPFFNCQALTLTLPGRLARSGRKAPVVLAAAALRMQGGFRMVVQPVTGLDQADPLLAASAMNAAVESLVRLAPEQYQWEYKRFKRQLPGSPDPYTGRRTRR